MESTNIRVLMITARADYGGGSEHIYQLIIHFSKDLHVFIASPKDKPYYDRYVSLLGKDSIFEIPHRKINLFHIFRLSQFIRSSKIDVIHSHGKGAGIYGRLLSILTGRKCIYTFHGVHIDAYSKLAKFLYISLEKVLSKFTKVIIAVSKGEFDKIVRLRIAKPEKIVLIENGVKIQTTKVSPEIFNYSKLNVITVSRFNYQKYAELLIPVVQNLATSGEIDRYYFHVFGRGESEESVKEILGRNGLLKFMTFHGVVSDLSAYYRNSFCYISTSRWEGMPLAVLEAMSHGVPVIATDVIGNNDIIEHSNNGFLFDLSEPDTAADLIVKLSRDLKLWSKLSDACVQSISKRYNVERMTKDTENIYHKLRISKTANT